MITPIDAVFYLLTYIFLFVSVFWLVIFVSKRTEIKKVEITDSFPGLSMIIPCFNSGKLLERCIKSLEKQNYPGLKITIVDDGSTDETGELGRKLSEKNNISYIRKENGGKASALNKGLKAIDTELFGFIDVDSYLSENALRNMVGKIKDNYVGVIASIRPHNKNNIVERLQKIEYMVTSFTRKLMSLIGALYYTPAFAIYKTDVIRKIGGFDEENMTEDLEIGLRIKDNGYDIHNSMNDFAYTDVPKTFRDLFNQRMRWYRGYIYNSIKYSHMFFNKKFSHLGVFVLPLQYVLLALSIPLAIYGALDILFRTLLYITDIFLLNMDIGYIVAKAGIEITPNIIFWGILLASFLSIMKISQISTNEKISKFEYLIYLLLYPFINTILWSAAFVYEILKVDKKW